jgi:hypothetical protein
MVTIVRTKVDKFLYSARQAKEFETRTETKSFVEKCDTLAFLMYCGIMIGSPPNAKTDLKNILAPKGIGLRLFINRALRRESGHAR